MNYAHNSGCDVPVEAVLVTSAQGGYQIAVSALNPLLEEAGCALEVSGHVYIDACWLQCWAAEQELRAALS